jgi:hypothetical protein
MTSWPGAPLAAAVELLALEGRGASGAFRLGRRTILVRRGRIADVSASPGTDPSLGEFLVAAGRLSDAARARLAMQGLDDVGLERAVTTGDNAAAVRSELRMDTLRESLRSVWMERLARAFSDDGDHVLAREGTPVAEGAYDVSTLALVLDALERCAAGGDAEAVGARAQEWVRFAAGPAVSRAKRWAQIEAPREVRVASVLAGSPASAPRLAALGRAGFLEILPGSNQGPPPPAPPPIKRTSSRPPPAQRPSNPNIPALGSLPEVSITQAPEARMSLAPPRAARVQLAPGAARVALQLDVARTFPTLTLGDSRLADPLDGPEDQVVALEEAGASAAARARAWRIVAEVARERLGALDEHARAAREAAAADPEDPDHLRRAAEACTAIEETELALAYGKAVVGVARSMEARARAMHDYALLCRRLGRREEALQAARAATQSLPDDPDGYVLAAEIELSLELRAEAADSFADAAALLHDEDPARSHLMSARAYRAHPASPRAAEQLATSLGRASLHDASIELRAELARLATDPDERRRLLLVAAERAELHGTPLESGALLLEAFDTDPTIDVVWAPLETDLAEAGARRERAIVLEEIALAAGDDASEWWAKAAEARAALEPDGSLELELRTRALVESPASASLLDAIRTFAERTGQPDAVLSALDRALRSARADASTRKKLAAQLAERADVRHPALASWAREIEKTGSVPAARVVAHGELSRAQLEAAALDPTVRGSAIAAARAQLEARYDPDLARALVVAARNEGLDEARAHAFGLLALHAGGSIERARLRALEAAYARFAGRHERASAACRDAIAQGHSDAEIGTRLRRTRAGDPDVDALARAAAWAAEAAHTKGALRARALAELACVDETRGQIGRALELAAEALREDRTCARAALLLLRRDKGAEWQRFGPDVARALRDLLGETAETLRANALTTAEPAEALATTVRWAALDPISSEPIFTSLALSEKHGLPEYDDAAIDALVTAPRCEPSVVDPLLRAIDRITPRDPKRALERALRGAAALGPWGHALRARAFEIGLAHHDHDGLVRAAESQLASPPGDRATHLRRIAQLRREGGDRAGEARTWVRLLATVPRDDEAIHRLAEIYAETGEHERLIAALSLRIEEGATPHERAIGHLELAAAYARTLTAPEKAEEQLAAAERELDALDHDSHDSSEEQTRRHVHLGHALIAMGRVERGMELLLAEARRAEPSSAVGHYESAIAAALREAQHLPRALEVCEEGLERCGTRGKLLLAFEQVALDLGDIAAAERTYTRLIHRAIGVHERRALAYRRARWLDRAGAARQALDAYVEACRHQASSGALLTALDRLSRAQGELSSLARGLRALAENAPHPTIRLSLLRRAASVMSSELADPRGALSLLAAEWKRSFASELEPDIARELDATTRVDREAAAAATRELVVEIERRAAEAWMGEERAHLLRKAVRLYATGLGDLETSEAYTWRAVAALRDENAEPDALRAPVEELAALFRARGRAVDLEGWVARATRTDGAETTPGTAVAPAPAAEPPPASTPAPSTTAVDATTASESTTSPEPTTASAPTSSETTTSSEPTTASQPTSSEAITAGATAATDATTPAAPGAAHEASPQHETSPPHEASPPHETSAPHEASAPPPAADELEATAPAARDEAPAASVSERLAPDEREAASTSAGATSVGIEASEAAAAEPTNTTSVDAPSPAAPPAAAEPPEPDRAALAPAAPRAARGWAPAPTPSTIVELPPELTQAESSHDETSRVSFVGDPRRIDDLLRTAELGEHRARLVAQRILSACEPETHEQLLSLDSTRLLTTSLEFFRHPGLADTLTVLRRIWENALPLFRKSTKDLGILGTDRVGAHDTSPLGKAVQSVGKLLSLGEPTVYQSRDRSLRGAEVLRTVPPSVRVSEVLAKSPTTLRFELARALELATPEHVLVASLSVPEGRNLFGAITAAFGPAEQPTADGRSAARNRDIAMLAADLWSTLPPLAQKSVRELLGTAGSSFDYDAVSVAVFAGAARLGLVACADPRCAVQRVVASDPLLAGLELRGRDALADALERSALLRDLVRFALSDGFVQAVRH